MGVRCTSVSHLDLPCAYTPSTHHTPLLGFLAFSTTGFGDFSPQTPAGRSVFVVWALFGVGTLTIVVSGTILLNVFHSHLCSATD